MPLLNYLMGREKLWRAYWLLGLAGTVYLTIVSMGTGVGAFPEPVGLTLEALYAVYYAVAIWNCAFNVENPLWGYLARFSVIGGLGFLALEIYLTARFS